MNVKNDTANFLRQSITKSIYKGMSRSPVFLKGFKLFKKKPIFTLYYGNYSSNFDYTWYVYFLDRGSQTNFRIKILTSDVIIKFVNAIFLKQKSY